MKKTVLFTPGRGETIDSHRSYQNILDVFEDLGYAYQFVEIDWGQKAQPTAEQVATQVRQAYNDCKEKPANKILAGFSLGAVASLQIAAEESEQPPAAVWCFSLSAFFKEDLEQEYTQLLLSEHYSVEQLDSYRKLSFISLASKIECPVQLFIGSEEYPMLAERNDRAVDLLPMAQLTVANDVGHDVTDPNYYLAVQAHLSTLKF